MTLFVSMCGPTLAFRNLIIIFDIINLLIAYLEKKATLKKDASSLCVCDILEMSRVSQPSTSVVYSVWLVTEGSRCVIFEWLQLRYTRTCCSFLLTQFREA